MQAIAEEIRAVKTGKPRWDAGERLVGRSASTGQMKNAINGVLVCAECGTVWCKTAKKVAEEMRRELRATRLDKMSAVDLLGSVADDSS